MTAHEREELAKQVERLPIAIGPLRAADMDVYSQGFEEAIAAAAAIIRSNGRDDGDVRESSSGSVDGAGNSTGAGGSEQ